MKKRNADAEGGGRGSKGGGGELGHAEEMLMINALLSVGSGCDECLLLTGPPLVRRLPLPLVRSWVLR